jgi:hypothetical protein
MTKDGALKLALEALEGVLDDAPKVLDASIAGGLYEVVQCRDAITAIKEALVNDALDKKAENARELGLDYEPLEAKDDPKCVAIVEVFGKDWRLDYMAVPVGKHKLYAQQYTYTTPPPVAEPHKRTWVGLTDEEVLRLLSKIDEYAVRLPRGLREFARAIEAAHGIKGEA